MLRGCTFLAILATLALVHHQGVCYRQDGVWRYPAPVASEALSGVTSRALRSVDRASKKLFAGRSNSPSGGGRVLLQKKKKSKCSWDDESGECNVSTEQFLRFLSKGPKDLFDMFNTIWTCTSSEEEDACMAAGCWWDGYDCILAAPMLNRFVEDVGKCFGAASVFSVFEDYIEICPEFSGTSSSECTEEECTWDESSQKCDFDALKTLIGIPTINGIPVGLDEVTEDFTEHLQAEALADDLPSLDPAEILQWKPAPFECPPDADPVLCDLLSPTETIFVSGQYCRIKYNNDTTGCASDPLCQVEDEECDVAESVENATTRQVQETLVESFSNDTAIQRILRPFVVCGSQSEEECGEGCKWNGLSGACEADRASFNVKLGEFVEESDNGSGGVCRLVSATLTSGCRGLDPSLCSENSLCEFEVDEDTGVDECGTKSNEDLAVEIVFEGNKKLQRKVKKTKATCNKKKSKKSCE